MTNQPMDYQHAPAQPKKRSLRWLWIGCGAVLLVGIVALGFGITWLTKFWDIGPAERALDKDVVAARAAGVPLEAKEIAPVPPVKPEENAGPLLTHAASEVSKLSKKVVGRLVDIAGNGSVDPAEASRILASQSHVFALAEQAAAKRRCDFKRDWDLGPALLFPDLAGYKTISKLFAARAELKARQGDHVGAVRDLSVVRRIGLHVASDPVLIPQLVGISCDSIAVAGVERCMALAKNPEELVGYESLVETGPSQSDPIRVLKGEAFNTVATLRNLKAFGNMFGDDQHVKPVNPATLKRSGMPTDSMTRAYMARDLEMWTAVLNSAKREQDPAMVYTVASRAADAFAQPPGVSYLMVKVLAPVYMQIGGTYRKDQVQWRLAAALARALRFKAENGRFPKDLAEIHSTSVDPFGNNLLYKTDGKSVRIYSVGPDGKDDGGKQRYQAKPGKGETWDIALSYPPSMTRDAAKILLKR